MLFFAFTISFCGVSNAYQYGDGVVYYNGYAFPADPSGGLKSADISYCTPGQQKVIRNQAKIELYSNSNTSKDKCWTASATYTAPPGWAIESAVTVVESANGTRSQDVDLAQSGQVFLSNMEIQNISQEVSDYIISLNLTDDIKADLNLGLKDFSTSYQHLATTLISTHSAVTNTATVCGRGILDAKRSWWVGYLDITLVCIPAEVTDSEILKITLKKWVDEQVGAWTPWLNRDSQTGNGDYETRADFSPSQVCATPMAIEARIIGRSTIYRPGDSTPDSLSQFSASKGLVCVNSEQTDGVCNNYEVRFLCKP